MRETEIIPENASSCFSGLLWAKAITALWNLQAAPAHRAEPQDLIKIASRQFGDIYFEKAEDRLRTYLNWIEGQRSGCGAVSYA
jgi:hypothetical protein